VIIVLSLELSVFLRWAETLGSAKNLRKALTQKKSLKTWR
jgi:hypothetical protein